MLASAPEKQRLQAYSGSAPLGFNWGIDPASPEQIHQAQIGSANLVLRDVDHDALADSVIDRPHHLPFLCQERVDCAADAAVAGPAVAFEKELFMPEAILVSAVRTPVGRAPKGALSTTRPDDLAALALETAVKRVPAWTRPRSRM